MPVFHLFRYLETIGSDALESKQSSIVLRESFSSFRFWALSWTSDSSATPKGIEFWLWNLNFLDALYAASEVWISSPWMQSILHSDLLVLYAACHHIAITCFILFTGDELLSDSFPYAEIHNGVLWEVEGKVRAILHLCFLLPLNLWWCCWLCWNSLVVFASV